MANAVVGALRVILGLNAGEFDKGTQKAGNSMDRLARKAKALGGAIGGAFAAAQLKSFATEAVRAFGVQEAAVKAVEATLRTTGSTAGFTSKELQAMASAMQEATTFGDEEILKKVTNNLLTFGNVVGPVFKRAQDAALDLSAVLGQDLQSSTIQLGKALNDPIKGITALSRVGIAFTEQQKALIGSLVESGKVMEAQGVILDEIEHFYGEAAEAMANTTQGALTQMSNAWGDAMEVIGESITPVVVPAANAIKTLSEQFGALSPTIRTSIVVFGGMTVALGAVAAAAGVFISVIGTMAGPLSIAVLAVAGLTAGVVALHDALTALEDRSRASLDREFNNVNSELEKVNAQLDSVMKKRQAIANEGGLLNFKGPRTQRLNKEIDNLLGQMNELKVRKSELEQAMVTKGWETSIEVGMVKPVIDLGTQTKIQTDLAKEALRSLEQQYEQLGNTGLSLVESIRTPHEVMLDQQAALQAAFDQSKISAEQFGNAMRQATYVSAGAYTGMVSDIVGSLSSVFGESKAFAIAQAIINTAEGVTRALAAYPPPFNFAAAAAVGAAGAAQIAAIKSTTKGGGGGGAAPAAPVAAAAPAAPKQAVNINLHGSRFGRDEVLGLMEQMNKLVGDGAVLKTRVA